MAKVLLLIFVFTGAGVEIEQVQFDSLDACAAAQAKLAEELESLWISQAAVCVTTGP